MFFPVALFAVVAFHVNSTPADPGETMIRLQGRTMGTTYQITYFDANGRNYQRHVDSILSLINKALSTYDPESEVSLFNRDSNGISFQLPYLYPVLTKAREVYTLSRGAFDPTVMPLVNAWGFGPGVAMSPTSRQIDSLMALVGFDKLVFDEHSIRKRHPLVQLDFGGIGQGFAVDVIAGFLRDKGIANMLVEIGGEGIAIGQNLLHKRRWQVAILDPASTIDDQRAKHFLAIQDLAFTTSGNYFNYRIVNGKKVGHTIDPHTGYPADSDILGASVFAKDCATADAWATALMVMGFDRAVHVLRQQRDLHAILYYSADGGNIATFVTPYIHSLLISDETTK